MTTFNNFPNQVYAATLTGSNGVTVTGSLGTPNKIITRLDPDIFTVSATDFAVNGTANFKGVYVSASSGYGFVEVGGPDGALIDLKRPFSDDYDLRISSDTPGGGVIENFNTAYNGAKIVLSGTNVGIGTTIPTTTLDVNGQAIIRGSRLYHSSSAYQAEIGPGAGTGDNNYYGLYVPTGKAISLMANGSGNTTVVLSGSNVGIGTFSPTEKLTVNGNISLTGEIIQESWIAPTLLYNFENFGPTTFQPAGYYKDKNGRVWLRGVLGDFSASGDPMTLPVFILPSGYRPFKRTIFIIHADGLSARLDVKTDGQITIEQADSATWYNGFSIDGISFDTRS